jgi:tripartite ATP-independent transporter DctM subunit
MTDTEPDKQAPAAPNESAQAANGGADSGAADHDQDLDEAATAMASGAVGALDGTGEGPPPGGRIEAILTTIVALGIILLPVVASLRRVADALRETKFLPPLSHSLGAVLGWLLPRDISWCSIYAQVGTLLIGFLGAILAAAGGKHLGLATTNFMPRGRLRSAAEAFSAVLFVFVALVVVYAGGRMVVANMAGGSGDHLPGGLPKWVLEAVMPIAFAVMAVRVVWRAADPRVRHGGGHGAPDPALSAMVLTPRQRMRRIVLTAVTGVLALIALYIGFRYDQSERIQHLVGRLDSWRGTVRNLGLLLLVLGFILGTPVFVVMAGMAVVLFFADDTPIASLPTETFRLVANPTLPAIPLLTIAGYVLAAGRSSQRLVRAYKSLFGWMPGGVAVMVVFVCAAFTTFTGASGVTILALGGLVYPMLVKDHYPKGFSLGLVTAAGSLGLLFPPSLPVLLYSVSASAPGSGISVGVDQLYIGGLIPGLLLVLMVSAWGIWQGKRSNAPRQPFAWKEARSALWAAKLDLFLPLVVMLPFMLGLATVVEAAALGAAYALVVELVVFRDVHPLKQMPGALVHAAALVGAVVVLLGVAMGLTNYLVIVEVPTKLLDWVKLHIESRWVFLLVLNGLLLILGSVLEIYSAIVVLVPLIAPLGEAFHVHPVHLGVIFLANLELGFLCPPMGLNLFLSATRFHKPLPVLYRHALPFLFIMSLGVLFITYVEIATLGLLRLLGKQ